MQKYTMLSSFLPNLIFNDLLLVAWNWHGGSINRMEINKHHKPGLDVLFSGLLLGEIIKKTWSLVDPWAGPRHLEAPPSLSSPWNVGVPCLSCSQRLLQRLGPEMAMWGWEHHMGTHNWTQLRPLYKLLRGGAPVRGSTRLVAAAQDKPGK